LLLKNSNKFNKIKSLKLSHNVFKCSVMLLISCVPDPPDPPGEPEATEVGGDFVSLTWDRPKSDGGGRILGYYIERKDAASDNWVRCNQTPCIANIYNVPNLIEDREYDFRVTAVNEAGESKPATTGRRIKVKDPKGKSGGQNFCFFK